MTSTKQVVRELRLGTAWARPAERALTNADVRRTGRDWDPEAVAGWRNQTLAASDLLTTHEVRVVAMRLAGFGPRTIRERAGTSFDRSYAERTALALALRYTTGLAPLRTGTAGHRLVRDGLKATDGIPTVVRSQAQRMWRDGASRAVIRQATGLGPTLLSRALAGETVRLSAGDITARFGWSPDNIHQKLSRPSAFPAEDGREGDLRWWWPATVDTWEATKTLVQCPHCPARVQRLRSHLRAHTRAATA